MKKRLDLLIVEKGLCESREKAKALIMAGSVYVNGQKELKAGTNVDENLPIEIRGEKCEFVSRGGYKLKKAVSEFSISLKDKICMDIGASTGGFSDCMLKNGAKKVYSIDVGYGQLAFSLRQDSRIVNMERTNFRYLKKEEVADEIDFASVDVSFISLKKIIPVAKQFLRDDATMVCLIKPQFEAGREKVGKNGVVRDLSTHKDVVSDIYDFILENGFSVLGLSFSPIKGPKGNIEYLIYIKNDGKGVGLSDVDITQIVCSSHEILNKDEKN